MRELKPPDPLEVDRTRPIVFLAGSIEMGLAEDWQSQVVAGLADLNGTVLNPRRNAWDATWTQDASFKPFRQQVEWELDAQALADVTAFYFAPETHAPVTLLELGLAAGRRRAVVCCPNGYWRRGNVEIVCMRYGIPMVGTLAEMVDRLRLEARPN